MPTDEEQIRQLVATWMSATKAGEIDKVLELMTDDVVFLVPGKQFGKQEFVRGMQSQATAGIQFEGESEIEEIQILGDTAFMISHLTVKVRQPASSAMVVRSGHTLSVFRKENGAWRLARDANLLAIESTN
jgi:uncharacterized protein (TIGR02246 family)